MNSLIFATSIFTIINRIRLPTIRNVDYERRLVVIRDLYVVKYGPFVSENEGHALLFLERNLSIPVPRLYAMYRYPRDRAARFVALFIWQRKEFATWPTQINLSKYKVAFSPSILWQC